MRTEDDRKTTKKAQQHLQGKGCFDSNEKRFDGCTDLQPIRHGPDAGIQLEETTGRGSLTPI